MKHETRAKPDLFRAAPLLLANVGWEDEGSRRARTVRLADAPAAVKSRHSALVDEFREKMRGLGGRAVLIVDRARDMENVKTLREAILCEAGRHPAAASLNPAVLDFILQDIGGLSNPAETVEPHCMPVGPSVSVVYPQMIGGRSLAGYLHGLPAPARREFFPEDAFGRITLYHETFGHGTEGDEFETQGKRMGAALRANMELRADIAAIAGSFRDTGDAHEAKAWIAVRDLAALRQTHQFFRKNARFSTEPVNYANGHILREVLAEIEEKGSSFRKLDDNALIAFVNDGWERHWICPNDYCFRRDIMLEAYSIAREADEGKTAWHDRLKRDDPQLCREALAYLDDCADALCLLCEVEPQQLRVKPAAVSRRRTRRGPSPRP